jgi:hypothetical protein
MDPHPWVGTVTLVRDLTGSNGADPVSYPPVPVSYSINFLLKSLSKQKLKKET